MRINLYEDSVMHPATDPQNINILHKHAGEQAFSEIGQITVDGATDWKLVERIFKIKAAESGADAVYISKIVNHSGKYGTYHESHFRYGFNYYNGFGSTHKHGYSYPRYYYCYGYNGASTWMTVIGKMIKYD